MSVLSHHFLRRRALAVGIAFTGSSVGGIVFPIMLNNLIHGRVGFAWGVRAAAFMTLGLLIIANMCMTTRIDTIKASPAVTEKKFGPLVRDISFWVAPVGYALQSIIK